MNNDKENIEIPFGAFDSELGGWEYTIPEGFEALIEDGKVIVRKAESEDEKIRKDLITYIKSIKGNSLDLTMRSKDWLSWLEKQGEQKPNYCHHEVDLSECSEEYRKAYYDGWNNCNMQHSQCKSELDDVVKCLINGMKFYYEDNEEATWGTDKWSMPVKHIIEVLEKQGEQKPVEEHDFLKIASNSYSSSFINYLDAHLYAGKMCVSNGECEDIENAFRNADWGKIGRYYNKFTQKPAWSEEDRENIQMTIDWLERYLSCHVQTQEARNDINGIISWLKSLKNRVQPQLKQEWSKEDERNRQEAIRILSDAADSYTEGSGGYAPSWAKCIPWLKSLRPQKQWKPSKEQMNALSVSVKHGQTDDPDALKKLLEQLKAL